MTLTVRRAVIWIVAVFGGALLAINLLGPNTPHPYVVYADVSDAADLLPNSFVKIDGIEAGVVEKIRLSRGENYAVVKLGMDKGSYPIGSGATASILPVNLLGEKYIALTLGDREHPQPSGSTIPMSRTTLPIELDDVFNTLNPGTRTALSVIINEAGLGLAGQAQNFAETLADLPPTVGAAKQVVGEIASQDAELRNVIVDGSRTLASIDGSKRSLQDLVSSGHVALASIDTARSNLGRTLDTAPAGLSQLRTTLGQLGQAASALTPASTALDATSPSLTRTLERLPAFTREAMGALHEAREVAPDLVRLGDQSTPVLSDIRPTAAALVSYTGRSQPFMNTLDQGSGLNNLLSFMNNWASVTSGQDGLGNYFNLQLTIDTNVVKHLLSAGGLISTLHRSAHHTATAKPRASAPTGTPAASTPAAGAPTTSKPTLSGTLSGLGSGLKGVLNKTGSTLGGLLGKVLAPKSSGSSSTTPSTGGLAATTGRLLGFLLGK